MKREREKWDQKVNNLKINNTARETRFLAERDRNRMENGMSSVTRGGFMLKCVFSSSANEIALAAVRRVCGPVDHRPSSIRSPESIEFTEARSEPNFKHEYFV